MNNDIKTIIDQLTLTPHPEGGYYRETYRSTVNISTLPEDFEGPRAYSTGIYFLLLDDNFSAFHRIKQDEMWHHYDGNPIVVHMISPEGHYSNVTIGKNIRQHETPQFVVPKGYWFASHVKDFKGYALVGCTVAPGFDFKDFELATQNALIDKYPDCEDIILQLTRG